MHALATYCTVDSNYWICVWREGAWHRSTCGNGTQSAALVHGMYDGGVSVQRVRTTCQSSTPGSGSIQSGSPGRTRPSPMVANSLANDACVCRSCSQSTAPLRSLKPNRRARHERLARAYNLRCSRAERGHHNNTIRAVKIHGTDANIGKIILGRFIS